MIWTHFLHYLPSVWGNTSGFLPLRVRHVKHLDLWLNKILSNESKCYICNDFLTHWCRMHTCVRKLIIFGSDNGLSVVTWSAPSHYLNQHWNYVNWTLRNKLQWNLIRNSYIFIQENIFQNVFWKMEAILSQPQCVNGWVLAQPEIENEFWGSSYLIEAEWCIYASVN